MIAFIISLQFKERIKVFLEEIEQSLGHQLLHTSSKDTTSGHFLRTSHVSRPTSSVIATTAIEVTNFDTDSLDSCDTYISCASNLFVTSSLLDINDQSFNSSVEAAFSNQDKNGYVNPLDGLPCASPNVTQQSTNLIKSSSECSVSKKDIKHVGMVNANDIDDNKVTKTRYVLTCINYADLTCRFHIKFV